MRWFANRYVVSVAELRAELTYNSGSWEWEVWLDNPGEPLAHGREIYLQDAKTSALRAARGLAKSARTAIRNRGTK